MSSNEPSSSEESDSSVASCDSSDSEDSQDMVQLNDLVENCKQSGMLFSSPIPARKEVHEGPDVVQQPSTSSFELAGPLTARDFEIFEDQGTSIANPCAHDQLMPCELTKYDDPMVFYSNQSCLSSEDVLTAVLEPDRLPAETNFVNIEHQGLSPIHDLSRQDLHAMEVIYSQDEFTTVQVPMSMPVHAETIFETIEKTEHTGLPQDYQEEVVYQQSGTDREFQLQEHQDEVEGLDVSTNLRLPIAATVQQKEDSVSKKADSTRIKKKAQEERMRGERYLGCRRKVKGKTNLIIRDTWKEERKLKDRGCSKLCERSTKTNCGLIHENERKELFGTFWKKMSWDSIKTYVVSTIRPEHVKERTNGSEASRRSYTYRYHLKVNDEQIQVCKNMYLNTLGLKDSETRHWLSTFREHSQPTAPIKNGSVEDLDTDNINKPNNGRISEGQTRRARVNRVEILEQFLNSLPKLPSHYCRKSSSKQYLQLDIRSKTQLYSLYVEHCNEMNMKPASLNLLRKKCKTMKIGVFKPRKDRCDLCYQFESGNLNEACYNQHIEKKNEASAEKHKDKEDAANPEKPDVHLVCIDLMAVQNLPLIRASASYYKLKLCIHNFTVYNLSTNDAICYWFDETATSLNASTFATMVVDYLQELLASSLRPIIIYSDGCTAQNRNSVLSNALLHLAVSSGVEIKQKYLEKGHTHMECDSVHSTVEGKFKYLDVFLPSNFVQITKSARRSPFPYRAKLVDYTFFKDFTRSMKYTSIRPGRNTGDPVVVDVRELLYCPSGIIKYKLRFSDQFKELPQRPRKASFMRMEDFPPMHNGPQNIPKDKWSDLQDLKQMIPQDCHHFYENLPHHDESIRKTKRKEQNKKL